MAGLTGIPELMPAPQFLWTWGEKLRQDTAGNCIQNVIVSSSRNSGAMLEETPSEKFVGGPFHHSEADNRQ